MKDEDYHAQTVLDLTKTKEERIQAAFKLENAKKEETIKKLCQGLENDPSPIVRHEYAFSLGETAMPHIAGPALKKAIENDDNIFVKHEAILALATLGKKEYEEFIKQYLNDKNAEMRESAEIALQRINNT